MCAFHSPGEKNGSRRASGNVKNGSSTIGNASRGSLGLIEPEGRMLKIIKMIQAEPLCRINDLAREFNLSHSHLEHLFKRETGVPLGQLLAEQRLRRAAYLLSDTNLRIKQIAQAVGYEHTSSFVRAFERHFAKTPRVYRRESAQTHETDAKLRVS